MSFAAMSTQIALYNHGKHKVFNEYNFIMGLTFVSPDTALCCHRRRGWVCEVASV